MIYTNAYLVGTHEHSFRRGVPGHIIGVKIVSPDNLDKRLCFHIRFADDAEDYVAVDDSINYEIISFDDIINGNIPKVK